MFLRYLFLNIHFYLGMEEDSLMVVGPKRATSIIVEGNTTSDLDPSRRTSSHAKSNGQPPMIASDSEEVYIIVNNTTNVQGKVRLY